MSLCKFWRGSLPAYALLNPRLAALSIFTRVFQPESDQFLRWIPTRHCNLTGLTEKASQRVNTLLQLWNFRKILIILARSFSIEAWHLT